MLREGTAGEDYGALGFTSRRTGLKQFAAAGE